MLVPGVRDFYAALIQDRFSMLAIWFAMAAFMNGGCSAPRNSSQRIAKTWKANWSSGCEPTTMQKSSKTQPSSQRIRYSNSTLSPTVWNAAERGSRWDWTNAVTAMVEAQYGSLFRERRPR